MEILNLVDNNKVNSLNADTLSKFAQCVTNFCKGYKNTKILNTNIRGVNANIDLLSATLNAINITFDYIVLTETRQLDNPDLSLIPGYRTFYNNSSINQNDGVVILVNEDITPCVTVVKIHDFSFLRVVSENVSVTGIYKLPSYNTINFIDALSEYITQYCSSNTEVLAGDINIDISDKNLLNPIAISYLNVLSSAGFTSYVTDCTRICGNSRSCIDHIFVRTKIPDSQMQSVICHHKITDHSPVLLQINHYKHENPQKNCDK